MTIFTPIPSLHHDVVFGDGGIEYLKSLLQQNNYSSIFLLVDTNTHKHCLPFLLNELVTDLSVTIIEIEAGEEHKNIKTCLRVWQTLSENGADRRSILSILAGVLLLIWVVLLLLLSNEVSTSSTFQRHCLPWWMLP